MFLPIRILDRRYGGRGKEAWGLRKQLKNRIGVFRLLFYLEAPWQKNVSPEIAR